MHNLTIKTGRSCLKNHSVYRKYNDLITLQKSSILMVDPQDVSFDEAMYFAA